MGISDVELGMIFEFLMVLNICFETIIIFYYLNTATQIWEKGEDKLNSMDFAEAIDNSDLDELGFTDDFIIELWGVITDARAGRLKN